MERADASVLGQYGIVSGSRSSAGRARDHLAKVSQHFARNRDLRWAFPYVYSMVTQEIVCQVDRGTFENPQPLLHWVVNFYELYVLNLNAFEGRGACEQPWREAFTRPRELRPDQPWGARSSAAFILGMYAHIKSDLPRALAYVHLKFSPDEDYERHKADFDSLNQKVFPAVMRRMAAGGTGIIPGVMVLLPERFSRMAMDAYARDAGLIREREIAWRLGRHYAEHPALVAQVRDRMQVRDNVTRPQLR